MLRKLNQQFPVDFKIVVPTLHDVSSVPKKGVVPVSRLSSKPVPTQTSNAARLAVAAAAVRRDQTNSQIKPTKQNSEIVKNEKCD